MERTVVLTDVDQAVLAEILANAEEDLDDPRTRAELEALREKLLGS